MKNKIKMLTKRLSSFISILTASVRIFIVMLSVTISILSFKAKAGCPDIYIEVFSCQPTNPVHAYFTNNSSHYRMICKGTDLSFSLSYGCGNGLISTDVSGGYAPCASSFPGASGYVPLSSNPFDPSPWSWHCTFNAPGTYQYIFCLDNHACSDPCVGCITLTIEVVDQIPFTIDGPHNNCLDADGWSTYTLVIPPAYAVLAGPVGNISWVMTGMTDYNISSNGNGATVFVDYGSIPATFDNGISATLCATITTCCGTQTVCIPIYKCCTCADMRADPSVSNAECVELNNTSASFILYDAGTPLISSNYNFLNGNVVTAGLNTLVINGQFIIDTPIEFSDCGSIRLGPEAQILIKNSASMTLSSYTPITTTLSAGCDIMWDGIYFEDNSAQLIINPPGANSYTILRDARNTIVSDDGEPFTIRLTKFENNNKDIIINNFTGQGPHSATVQESVFTSNSSMLPYYTFVPNIITNNSPLTRTNVGIEINNVDDITIGPPGQLTLNNTFSNMDLGIVSNNSYLHSKNNWFSSMHRITACPNPLTSPCAPEGVGIYSKSTVLTLTSPALEVGGSTSDVNKFTDVDDGVYAEGPQDATIGYNSFSNVKRGVYATRNFTRNVSISQNTIDQFSTGIWAVNNPSCYIEIDNNTLNGIYATIQQGTAIKAEEPQQNAQFSSIVKIHDNIIRRIRTGIQATNLAAAQINMVNNNGNDIMFETAHPNTWNASYGIRVQNNYKSLVQDNTVYRCSNNFSNSSPTTNCFPVANTPSDYTNKLIGISMEKSSFCNILNNSTAYLGTGIRDFFTNTANTYNCNTMAYCQWMLWLDNSNPGPGPQGSSATSQGNQWRSDPLTGFNVQYNVWGPSPTATGQQWFSNPFGPILTTPPIPTIQPNGVVVFQSATNANNNCSYPQIIGNDPGDIQKQLADLLAWTRDENCTLTNEGKFIAQVEIYKELLYDNSLMNLGTSYDTYLTDFYNDEANTDVGIMAHVRYDIDAKDYEDARSSNSTLTPDNQADANEKATNEIYLDTWAKDIYTFTQQQYTSLSDIAAQNPISGGPAVYTARVMLGVDYDDFGALNRLSTESQFKESYMRLYPNPASDELNIVYSLGESIEGALILSDVTGRVILNENLNSEVNKKSISTKFLEQGVYFVRIKISDNSILSEKLLIIR